MSSRICTILFRINGSTIDKSIRIIGGVISSISIGLVPACR
ncbi:hypothetical protein PA08_1646 [Cutibacterium modestum P08]|nr:hypothetical protein PA08_1646 [Cutibacterium modestum P08]